MIRMIRSALGLTSTELTDKILRIGTLVAIAAVLIVTVLWAAHSPADIDQKRLYFDAYKAIGIGFLVALLGMIIPNLILERRDNRERAEISRRAYSEAKTSVLYLPGNLAVLEFGDAMRVLEESHRKLHIAETYVKELRRYLEWYNGEKDIWTAQQYWELTAVKELLQANAGEWQDTKLGKRVAMVTEAQVAIRNLFGWKGKDWKILVKETGKENADKRVHEEVDKVSAKYSTDGTA